MAFHCTFLTNPFDAHLSLMLFALNCTLSFLFVYFYIIFCLNTEQSDSQYQLITGSAQFWYNGFCYILNDKKDKQFINGQWSIHQKCYGIHILIDIWRRVSNLHTVILNNVLVQANEIREKRLHPMYRVL